MVLSRKYAPAGMCGEQSFPEGLVSTCECLGRKKPKPQNKIATTAAAAAQARYGYSENQLQTVLTNNYRKARASVM